MSELLLTLERGAQSLADATKMFQLFPANDEVSYSSAWDNAGELIAGSWGTVGHSIQKALNEFEKNEEQRRKNDSQ